MPSLTPDPTPDHHPTPVPDPALDHRPTLVPDPALDHRRRPLRRGLAVAAATVLVLATGATAALADTYEVRPGDSLASIADGLDGVDGWHELYEANRDQIDDPDLIFPGQQLTIDLDAVTAGTSDTTSDTTSGTRSAATSDGSVWDRLAQCESDGDWSINTGNGYYGGLQFKLSSWQAVGGTGHPHEASREEQIARAERLLELQGWGAWPACARQLGLR